MRSLPAEPAIAKKEKNIISSCHNCTSQLQLTCATGSWNLWTWLTPSADLVAITAFRLPATALPTLDAVLAKFILVLTFLLSGNRAAGVDVGSVKG